MEFVKQLITENNYTNKYFLMDNIKFHHYKPLKEYIESTQNKIIYIPPYSPEFNPIEEVFSSIKNYIRNNSTQIITVQTMSDFIYKYSKRDISYMNFYVHAFR